MRWQKIQYSPNKNKQAGYMLFIVTLFVSLITVAAAQYLDRSTRTVRMAGATNDISESLNLAEAAVNMLAARFTTGDDINGDGIADNEQTVFVAASATPALPYLFYVTSDVEIDQTAPSILQRVADGESNGSSTALTTQTVLSSSNLISISGLFTQTFSPLLFTAQNGQFQQSNNSWQSETSERKAAAWVEIIQDPVIPSQLNLYAQAVGQVGNSKSYVQRFIGAFSVAIENGTILGGGLSPLVQSSG